MKILFLFPHFFLPGGAANVTVKFARGLQEKGHLVEILCANASPDFLAENSDLKISQLRIPNSNSFFYWALLPYWQLKINKSLKKYEDYLFVPQVLPSNWWAWIYKLSNKDQKIIWYCNEPSAFIHSKKWIGAIKNPCIRIGAKIANPLLKYADTWLEKQNDFAICNSRFTATEYERCYKRKANKIIYPPSLTKKFPIERDKENYIFTVSRLSKFKNVDLLIETFVTIGSVFPKYKLKIAGEGEEKENLKKLVVSKGIANKVELFGKISNGRLADLYAKAKVTVFCSENEPFGIVPVESMVYGTPVIAHNSGGPRETIRNNETGLLFDNKSDLINCIKKIIEMPPAQYLKMQEACQEKAAKYDMSNSISKLETYLGKQ